VNKRYLTRSDIRLEPLAERHLPTASERVAARCGYAREGVLRSIHFKPDKRIDAAIWSRLPSD
jgi:hypothetical protein